MRGVVLVVLVFATPALAGCSEDPARAADSQATDLPFNARAIDNGTLVGSDAEGGIALQDLSRHDWFVLPFQAAPSGGVAGFRIPVPEGASVPTGPNADRRQVVVELVILGDADVEAFHALFGQSGEVLTETNSFAGAGGWGASVNTKSYGGEIGGQYVDIDAAEGGEMFLAVAAIGSGDATIGLRFMPSDPFRVIWEGGEFEPPAADGEEFLGKVEGRRGVFIEPHGAAGGAHMDFFYEYHGIGLGVPSWTRFTYGDMVVADPVPDAPADPVIMVAAAAEAPAGPGYSSATVWVWNELHVGLIEATITTPDGVVTTLTSPLVPDPVVSSTIALSHGEGMGGSGLEFTLRAAGTPTLFPQLTLLAHVRLDATLETLVGETVEGRSESHGGPVFVGRDELIATTPRGALLQA